MTQPSEPENEQQRLEELYRYGILDTPYEADFDDLARIAALVCGTPTALVTLVDRSRQWFKAKIGFDQQQTSREHSFCAHAIHQSSIMVVPDATLDARFSDNPLVVEHPGIRFYAGAPLETSTGSKLGTLCVIDSRPRTLDHAQQSTLEALARQVVRLIELRHRVHILGTLVDKSPAAIDVKDRSGRYILVNECWTREFGRAGESPSHRSAAEWFGGNSGGSIMKHDLEVLQSGEPREVVESTEVDGLARSWLALRFPMPGIDAPMLGTMRFDLTRTLLAEENWQKSEEKFRVLCQSASDAIITAHQGGQITFWNAAAERIFGYSEQEAIGQRWEILLDPSEHRRLYHARRRADVQEFTGIRRDGSRFPLQATFSRWRTGNALHVTAIVRDVTERRNIESQLEQARRMDSLGRVAATVAHEFNNVLMGIGPANTLIARLTAGDQRVERATDNIRRSVERATGIVQQILRFSRPEEPMRHRTDLCAWMLDLSDLLRSIATENMVIDFRIPPLPIVVSADTQQLEQVVVNLVANARDAMNESGRIEISIEDRNRCHDAAHPAEQRCARIEVSDTGAGMSEETIARAFEPLFTTKRAGTGIGLSLSQRIIENHGGVISVTSEIGRGSTFVIHLPLIE